MGYELVAEYCTPKEISDFLGLYPNDEYDLVSNSGATETYPDRLYVGANNIPLFTVNDFIRVWDENNHVGDERYIIAIGSNYVQLNTELTGHYLVVDHAKFRPLSLFTNRSNPSISEVNTLILMAQDVIDERTNNSFLSGGRRREEWYDFMPHFRRRFPAFNILPFTPPDTFWWIRFKFSPVHPLSHENGDFIRLNMGSSFVDILDPANGYVAWDPTMITPRTDGAYWLDSVNGFLFLISVRPTYTPYAAFIGYRYGEHELKFSTADSYEKSNYIPYDIKRATILLVCIDILSRERYALNAPGGDIAGQVDIKRQIDMWSYEVDRLLARHENFMSTGGAD